MVTPPPTWQITFKALDRKSYGKALMVLLTSDLIISPSCFSLKRQLELGKAEHERKMAVYAKEEQEIREENLRLQRRLQLEMERREALCRHLSESESR